MKKVSKMSLSELSDKELKAMAKIAKVFGHKEGLRHIVHKIHYYYFKDNFGNKIGVVKDIPTNVICLYSVEEGQDLDDSKLIGVLTPMDLETMKL